MVRIKNLIKNVTNFPNLHHIKKVKDPIKIQNVKKNIDFYHILYLFSLFFIIYYY
jgi:hypothetical protein